MSLQPWQLQPTRLLPQVNSAYHMQPPSAGIPYSWLPRISTASLAPFSGPHQEMIAGAVALPHLAQLMFSLEILRGACWTYNSGILYACQTSTRTTSRSTMVMICNRSFQISAPASWVPGQLNMAKWTMGNQFSVQPCVSRISWSSFIKGKADLWITLNLGPVGLKFLMSSQDIFPPTPVQSPEHFWNCVSLFSKCTLFGWKLTHASCQIISFRNVSNLHFSLRSGSKFPKSSQK